MYERGSWKSNVSLVAVFAMVAIFAFRVWTHFRTEKSLQRETHAALVALVETSPGYAAHKPSFDEWIAMAHDEAFSSAYTRGGRRGGQSFNEQTYWVRAIETLLEETAMAGLDADAMYFRAILVGDDAE